MTFVAAELAARLRIDGKAAFDRGLDDSGRKFGVFEKAANRATDAGKQSLAWAGTAFNVATVGASALIAKTFATGAAYNAMQQSSRAAMATLMGGAEQANAQMDRLDTFAKTSPFSKAVFIQAQQQMIGFGYSAEQVIPTLDAIQNAVAAIGGSNEQISEIVLIMSQIKAAGKITGEDLMQFAGRGINAAELIGQAMGKTGPEIKEAISKGTIGGDEALTALTKSMETKFAGTTGKIKEQWAGASDRIKAATRDIGAAMAKPFIDPNGGGQAVIWGNQFADLLRAIEKQTGPLMGWVTGKMGPAFQRVSQYLVEAKQAVAGLDVSSLDDKLQSMSTYGPGLAGAAGALAALGTQHPILAKLGFSINPVVAGFLGIVAASPELRSAGGELLKATAPLIPVLTTLAGVIARGINGAVPVASNVLSVLADVLGPIASAAAQIPGPVLAGAVAFTAMHLATRNLAAAGSPAMKAMDGIRDAVQDAQQKTLAAGGSVTALSTGLGVVQGAATNAGNALKAAFISNPIGIALTVISTAVSLWAMANATAQQDVEAHKQATDDFAATLDKTTGALTQASLATVAAGIAEKGYGDLLKQNGINATQLSSAILGQGGSYTYVRGELDKKIRSQMQSIAADDRNVQAALKLGMSLDDLTAAAATNTSGVEYATKHYDAMTGTFGQYSEHAARAMMALREGTKPILEVSAYLEEQRGVVAEAQEQQRQFREAVSDAAGAMSEAERRSGALNDAIGIARDVSQDATTRLNALKDALDLLTGGGKTAAEQQVNLARKTLDLNEAFAQTNQNGDKLWQGFIDGSGKINLTTREGVAFQEQLTRMNDDMLTAMQTAYDLARAQGDDVPLAMQKAKDAANPYIQSLRDTASQAGLTQEQVDGLVAAYLANPDYVTTIIGDGGTIDETKLKLLDLARQIDATPDKTITINEPLSPAVIERMKLLGWHVTTLPDGNIRIQANNVDQTESVISNVARDRISVLSLIVKQQGQGTVLKESANGNLFVGGKPLPVKAFANGGFPSGMYRGRPGGIHKFAEEETLWELYLSGKPNAKARNQKLLEAAAPMLDMRVIPNDRAMAPVTAAGGAPMPSRTYRVGNDGSGGNTNVTIQQTIVAAPGMDEGDLTDLAAEKVAKVFKP